MEQGLLVVALAGAAVIHLIPVVGALSVDRLERLYGTAVAGPELAVLLRHRAVLFGIMGALLIAAIVDPALRWPMVVATLVSDLSFAGLMRSHPGTHQAMARVFAADVVSIVLLAVAAVCLVLG